MASSAASLTTASKAMAATTPQMLLLGVDIARAEEDRERAPFQPPRAKRRTDLVDAARAAAPELADAGNGLQRRGDCLELQRDIGRDADDGDDGDQHGEPARLAEPRR